MVEQIEEKLGPIVDKHHYNAAIVLRNYAFFKSDAVIETGLASYELFGFNGTSSVDYLKNDLMCYTYKIKFFI